MKLTEAAEKFRDEMASRWQQFSNIFIHGFDTGFTYRDAEVKALREALSFYADHQVNYYMRNDSEDEDGKEDGFVNWTDREVDRGSIAREALKTAGGES